MAAIHSMCINCWIEKHALDGRAPARLNNADPETCCYCGGITTAGIYVTSEYHGAVHCTHDTPPTEKP